MLLIKCHFYYHWHILNHYLKGCIFSVWRLHYNINIKPWTGELENPRVKIVPNAKTPSVPHYGPSLLTQCLICISTG